MAPWFTIRICGALKEDLKSLLQVRDIIVGYKLLANIIGVCEEGTRYSHTANSSNSKRNETATATAAATEQQHQPMCG